ncbi:hypothetical protein PG985_003782 [Apiospora marii]|uniref:DUF7924 domain-containing protein n=1 Tax=Apiospora marii TaxID=335849 RepID=A0ABR1SH34_9PEZI
MSQGMKNRSLDNVLPDGENHQESAKLLHGPESMTSRGTDWPRQVPSEDPDATCAGPEEPAPLTGSVATAISSCPPEPIPEMFVTELGTVPDGTGLTVQLRTLFKRECVPGRSTGRYIIETPQPDFTYGYDTHDGRMPFSETQWEALGKMTPQRGWVSESADLALPFLVVEVFRVGSEGDSHWVAENRMLGDASSCVKVVRGLNDVLRRYPDPPLVIEMSYTLVVNQLVGHFYVTWSEADDANEGGARYNTRQVDQFDLEKSEGWLKLRHRIENVLEWGKGERLEEIQKALDFIHEQDQKMMAVSERC